MRYVYIDEAGISDNEPVAVVVGIIVNADRHYLRTEAALRFVLGKVPTGLGPNFISHAKSIWGIRDFEKIGP
jgi:hypothetical protein